MKSRSRELNLIAARKFRQLGYADTSLQSIADEMGVLKGSLYHYINSKQDLLYNVVWRNHMDFVKELENVRELDGEPIAVIRETIRGQCVYICNNLDGTAVTMQDLKYLEPEQRRQVNEARNAFQQFLVDELKAGQKAGTIDEDLDPKLAALILFGQMNSLCRWYRPGGEYSVRVIADQIARQSLASIRARDI